MVEYLSPGLNVNHSGYSKILVEVCGIKRFEDHAEEKTYSGLEFILKVDRKETEIIRYKIYGTNEVKRLLGMLNINKGENLRCFRSKNPEVFVWMYFDRENENNIRGIKIEKN